MFADGEFGEDELHDGSDGDDGDIDFDNGEVGREADDGEVEEREEGEEGEGAEVIIGETASKFLILFSFSLSFSQNSSCSTRIIFTSSASLVTWGSR